LFEPVPRIFCVFADVFFENNAEKKLHRLEAGFVDMWQSGQHSAYAHVESPKALVAVADRGVDKTNFVAHFFSNRTLRSFKPFQSCFGSGWTGAAWPRTDFVI